MKERVYWNDVKAAPFALFKPRSASPALAIAKFTVARALQPWFAHAVLQVACAHARAGAPAWVYQVDFAARTEPERGAFHSIDIALVFGTLGAKGSLTGTAADARAASAAMQAAFLAFARTGDPGGAWPRYDLARRSTMIFDTRSRVEDDPRRWQRELFARVPYIQPGT